ncbi:MAG: hypothetical protein GX793_08105 [Bacteroidales bacterium]|jgi:hypothetical protein|nr:hypothetical protein [Bacteroidales bacterium]MCK9498545.1 hypothetical protein [Bacteroidales bacterium]MDY0314328.1 hypothetical protein [Bacteroidales bacterium]NLB86981.1 hypothetical protein [Bacteroidales bacterium]NLB87006.1 hypothetical protein [Bacteroidales bacterium]
MDKFKATFYADLSSLKELIQSEKDLLISIPTPRKDYDLFWDQNYINISILDILNWAAFGFYEYFETDNICTEIHNAKKELISKKCINPQKYYYQVIECLDWICSKFEINNFEIKDFSSYRYLRHFLFDNEGYLDEEDIKDALKTGFRKIDLDLINAAEIGNGIECNRLISEGANYKIDPLDFTDVSLIIEILDGDLYFHTLNLISYLSEINKYDKNDYYEMLSSLYQVGVSNYILDIIIKE